MFLCFIKTIRLAHLLKTSLPVRRPGIRFPGRSNWTQCRQRLSSAATFFWSRVSQALIRRDGPRTRYTLRRNIANINEDLILKLSVHIFFVLRLMSVTTFQRSTVNQHSTLRLNIKKLKALLHHREANDKVR